MKKRTSALYRRTDRYSRRSSTGLLGAGAAVAFAAMPLGVMLWVLPATGFSIA